MLDFTLENISSEEIERLRAVYGSLAESVRELIDATVRTEMDAEGVAAAKAEIDSTTARLRQKQTDGSFGVRYPASGERMAWGNAVIGLRNPIAPPVEIRTISFRYVRANRAGRATARNRFRLWKR
ncbi:MAG TPA: hypothetical protein VE908_05560 [Mycobacterium sp.]|jgi:hypothetical protein|nr:hypothetical protein [Mycobacterium sp.]